jgi:hypothetical protein
MQASSQPPTSQPVVQLVGALGAQAAPRRPQRLRHAAELRRQLPRLGLAVLLLLQSAEQAELRRHCRVQSMMQSLPAYLVERRGFNMGAGADA